MKQYDLPLRRKLGKLSRGMRMKAALVSALAFHPKLIVLDEPFGGLDPLVRDELVEGLLERAPESTIFISSHDLSEFEKVASHVGYLEGGRLHFSEEMGALVERFREVELTFEATPPRPENPPASWMQIDASSAVVRFVESRFDDARTRAEIRERFGNPRYVTFAPCGCVRFSGDGEGRAGSRDVDLGRDCAGWLRKDRGPSPPALLPLGGAGHCRYFWLNTGEGSSGPPWQVTPRRQRARSAGILQELVKTLFKPTNNGSVILNAFQEGSAFVLKWSAGKRTNADPSLESVQDDRSSEMRRII